MAEKRAIRVMIVDDHEVVRRGLASYLEGSDDFELVASVGSGEEAVRMCPRVHPDVVLMDVVMPQMDGIEATRRIKAIYPDIKVLALTGLVGAEAINDMFAAGAVGYLLKSTPIDDLQHLIRTVHAGRMTFSPEVAQVLLASQRAKTNSYDLTEREFEVLRLIVAGCNNPQIAQKLVISRSTVGYHVSSIINKLGVHNRMEVAFVAMKENLITEEAAAGIGH
jgi:NarL family two-component system response regulator LiaR